MSSDVTRTPDIVSVTSRFRVEPLTQAECGALQGATLRLLDEVGVHVPSVRALDVFAGHEGARADAATGIVKLSPDLVRAALARAPRTFVLAGREERFDLLLDGTRTYVATDGVGTVVIDDATGAQRPSRKADVERMARIVDALPLVSFYWPLVSAQDHGLTAPLHECHAGLTNTLKHVRGGTTVRPPLARYIVEMAVVVGGGEAELRRRPPICANICTISPLAHDRDGLECALTYAEAGIPVSFMAMPTMGSSAPASPLGALVQGDAEVVSGMVLIQLAFPGAPVFHSVLVSQMEPHTGGYLSEVPLPIEGMQVQLAHAWGVPSLGGGSMSSDAPGRGWGAGRQAGFGSAMVPLYGGEVCGYLGLAEGSTVLSAEQVVLDHEACRYAIETLRGTTLDEGELATALDDVRAVGPRGHFLGRRLTRERSRRTWVPFWLRREPGMGAAEGPRERGRRELTRIEATHRPELLPADAARELARVLAAADREAERLT